MTRTLSYVDDVQVTKTTAQTVKDILFGWHDPTNNNFGRHIRLAPATTTDENGDEVAVTDGSGNPMWDVHLKAEMKEVPEADIQTEKANLVSAINDAFPAEWPTVDEAEVTIR